MASYCLFLQSPEEGFDRPVILTVTLATHAGEQAMRLAEPIPFIVTKLRVLIRVDHHVLLGLASSHGYEDGVQRDFLG